MENWKHIKEYPKYEISDLGRVRNIKSGRFNKPAMHGGNLGRQYQFVDLYDHGKHKMFDIHRLVALHFIRSVGGKNEVNHKNGIKTDNRVENLEWVDSSENKKHAYAHGLIKQTKGKRGQNITLVVKRNLWSHGYNVTRINRSIFGCDLLVENKYRIIVERKHGLSLPDVCPGNADCMAIVSKTIVGKPDIAYYKNNNLPLLTSFLDVIDLLNQNEKKSKKEKAGEKASDKESAEKTNAEKR